MSNTRHVVLSATWVLGGLAQILAPSLTGHLSPTCLSFPIYKAG